MNALLEAENLLRNVGDLPPREGAVQVAWAQAYALVGLAESVASLARSRELATDSLDRLQSNLDRCIVDGRLRLDVMEVGE